jgi:enoyl-CoA hydratase
MSAFISLEQLGDGVSVIRLARPQARNALTLAMMRELRALLAEIANDQHCRVLLLAAEGDGFCAGLDLKQALQGEEAPQHPSEWMALQELFAGTIAMLRALPQPIVAAIQGAAVGAGFGIALAADVRVTAITAKFLVGAVKVGLSAGECGISYHLPRLIGAGRAFEIMLTGREVAAQEAFTIGLSTALVPTDDLFTTALATARSIASNSNYSIKHTKQVMWSNLNATDLSAALKLENHVQVIGLLTNDFHEAALAFAAKRPPKFQRE